MDKRRNSRVPAISAGAFFLGALLLLVFPLKWLFAAVAAAAFHELCHMGAVRLVGGQVSGFRIGERGAVMTVGSMTRGRELFCAMAGPVGGLSLLLAARWLPRTAVCGAFQSLYNLLPLYPLDGGRALRCLTELLLPPRYSAAVCTVVGHLCRIGLLVLGIYGTFVLELGLLPALLAAVVLIQTNSGNITCKVGRFHVK